jgi:hypothetical protein
MVSIKRKIFKFSLLVNLLMNKSVVFKQKGRSFLSAVLLTFVSLAVLNVYIWDRQNLDKVPFDTAEIIDKCNALKVLPAPPSNFHQRSYSDRFEHGTPPTLFRNATIWTGRILLWLSTKT